MMIEASLTVNTKLNSALCLKINECECYHYITLQQSVKLLNITNQWDGAFD